MRAAGMQAQRGVILVFSMLMMLGIFALGAAMMWNSHHSQVSAQNYKNRIRAFYASDGVRALLAQEVLDGNHGRYIDDSKSGEIEGIVYDGASSLAALKAARAGGGGRKEVSDYLGCNWKSKGNYGVVWRGYIIPPANGAYTFYVRADDAGEFYLSEDETEAKLSKVAIASMLTYKSKWTNKWEKKKRYRRDEGDPEGTGVSEPIGLKVGKRYYFEFLHVQSWGDGFGQVAWSGPNYIVERPIPGKRLASYGSKQEKWDTAMVGKGTVRYSLAQAGPMVFNLSTEAVMGGAGDSVFRAPLNQTLSMLGDNPAPPDTLWQRVIFYDFRADGSNPEFERGNPDFFGGTVTPDLVRRKGLRYTTEDAAYFGLDSIGKPYRGTNPKWSCGVEKWFVPWKPGWKKTYPYAGGSGDCTEADIGHDQVFVNQVFKDSLPFIRRHDLGANAYQFKRFAPPLMDVTAFAPLDGRGWGDEGKRDGMGTPHNFGFCMELHTQFEHTSGMTFEFNGDDDVWLYINDSLVMDQGFVHESQYTSLNLDDLVNLKFGETYPLDFFYCERQSSGSSIDLITNLPVLLVRDKPTSTWKRDYGDLD